MAKALVRRVFEVTSSDMIHKIGYDPATPGIDRGFLLVQFSNLDVYGYKDVTFVDYVQLLNAPSVGAYFTSCIKTKYTAEPISRTKDARVVNPADVTQPKRPKDELPMFDMADAPRRRP